MMNNRFWIRLSALLLLPGLLLSGCGKKAVSGYLQSNYRYESRDPVATVGGQNVPLDLYRFYYLSNLQLLTEEADARDTFLLEKEKRPDDNTLREQAKDATEAALREFFAIRALCAEYQLYLKNESYADAKAAISESVETAGGQTELLELLRGSFMTEEVYYNLLLGDHLEGMLFDYMTKEFTGIIDSTDKTVEADLAEHFYAAAQIYFPVTEKTSRASALESAKALLEDAKEADLAHFLDLAKGQGDGYGVRYFTDGYTFAFFEDAVKALQPGETSPIIESSMGYHIIRRVPLDPAYLNRYFDDLRYDYLTRRYHELLQEKADSLSFDLSFDPATLQLPS